MKDSKSSESRRKLLKSIAAGSGAIVTGKNLPESWTRPVVDSVMVPVHAQTTCCDIAGTYCVDLQQVGFFEITVSANGSISVVWNTGDPIYNASASVSCTGGVFDADFNTGAAPASITGTISCGQTSISGNITNGAETTPYTADEQGCLLVGSDRNIKENFTAVDEQEILEKVAKLPIETWNYTDRDTGVRHIGPMAQDFYSSFGVGSSDKVINMVDANGVNLAAIKALNAKLAEKDAQISALQEQLDAVIRKLDELI